MFTPETRRYIYGIVTAASPLIISAGIVSEGIVQQVLLVIAAILGVATPSLAVANVPKTEKVIAESVVPVVPLQGAIIP
jgi:uncharacterized membrane protein